jgi:hypothetical protein
MSCSWCRALLVLVQSKVDKEPCCGQRSWCQEFVGLDLTGGVAAFAGETDNSSERVGEAWESLDNDDRSTRGRAESLF